MQFYSLKKLTFGIYVRKEIQNTITCYCEMHNFIYHNNISYAFQLVTMIYRTLLQGFFKRMFM